MRLQVSWGPRVLLLVPARAHVQSEFQEVTNEIYIHHILPLSEAEIRLPGANPTLLFTAEDPLPGTCLRKSHPRGTMAGTDYYSGEPTISIMQSIPLPATTMRDTMKPILEENSAF